MGLIPRKLGLLCLLVHLQRFNKILICFISPNPCMKLFPELLECADLHSVIRLVLETGNYMNSVSIIIPLDFVTIVEND